MTAIYLLVQTFRPPCRM